MNEGGKGTETFQPSEPGTAQTAVPAELPSNAQPTYEDEKELPPQFEAESVEAAEDVQRALSKSTLSMKEAAPQLEEVSKVASKTTKDSPAPKKEAAPEITTSSATARTDFARQRMHSHERYSEGDNLQHAEGRFQKERWEDPACRCDEDMNLFRPMNDEDNGEKTGRLQLGKVDSKAALLDERAVISNKAVTSGSQNSSALPASLADVKLINETDKISISGEAQGREPVCHGGHHRQTKHEGKMKGKQGPKGKGKVGRSAAGVIMLVGSPRHPERVVITCQLRRGKPSWGLPKGGVEVAELADIEDAAAREFREETGIVSTLDSLTPLPAFGQSWMHWFLAQAKDESELLWGPIQDEDTLEAKCLNLSEATRILRSDHKQLLLDVVRVVQRGEL